MDAATKWRLSRIVLTWLYLLAGWLLFSWSLAPANLALGAAFALVVACLTYDIFIDSTDAQRRSLLPRPHMAVAFVLVLVFRMYVASFRVLFQILRGRMNPRVVHFRTRLRSDLARVLLSTAITMTPGTVTLALDDDHLVVHWLDAKTTHSRYAGKLIMGSFEWLLARVFG